MHLRALAFWLLALFSLSACAQSDFYLKGDYRFTRADTLRGSLRPERTCYDVTFYGLDIRIDPSEKTVEGYVDIAFRVVEPTTRLQLDLDERMELHSIELDGTRKLAWYRDGNAIFVHTPLLHEGAHHVLRVHYGGKPRVAPFAPWQGGFVWEQDPNGKPWVGVACEGDGASLWWPNKDHLSDEPDSASIRVAVPPGLVCVANGRLRAVDTLPSGWPRYHWVVSYPINNYNITVNIGDYAHFHDLWVASDGDSLDLDFYVLRAHLEKAKEHFKQVHGVLSCFEKYFGKYPFWDDGYALVETPYLGMEHQGAIAYGNRYMRGYLGGMIPRDMDWDYIIVHETGHEWFGNCLSVADLAEMWIHESFTTYMEAVYVECRYGYDDAVRYLRGQRAMIANREPILGPKGVNWEDWQGSDHYYKGAWVLHTLRHAIGEDELWWHLLKSFYQKHACSIVRTEEFVQHVQTLTGRDWSAFFAQYLEWPSLPVFEYRLKKSKGQWQLEYRWRADLPEFDMPLWVESKGEKIWLQPRADTWQRTALPSSHLRVPTELFLIETKKVK